MEKRSILFWIFEIIILYIILKLYSYFISPIMFELLGTAVFDLFIILIIFVPLSLVLSKWTTDYFLD